MNKYIIMRENFHISIKYRVQYFQLPANDPYTLVLLEFWYPLSFLHWPLPQAKIFPQRSSHLCHWDSPISGRPRTVGGNLHQFHHGKPQILSWFTRMKWIEITTYVVVTFQEILAATHGYTSCLDTTWKWGDHFSWWFLI